MYVESVVANLRDLGAVVILGAGLHGKAIIIDERVHYTGSLNWASHRGRREIMHRTDGPALSKLVLQFLQAQYIRRAGIHEDGSPRRCPEAEATRKS
jgi:phosphatidylserine/phosphatidylglycerophosphate/cardiolipin synthase-like enzyme